LARHPTLPPKQRPDYQVDVGGKIRLASRSRARASAQYKQATSRQRLQITTGQMPQAPFHPVSHDCSAYLPADDEADQRRVTLIRLHEQVTRDQRPARPAAASCRRSEVGPPPHPRRCREHLPDR
jgi:hypothetical protein